MIEIRGLQKSFGSHHVLKGIDASITQGEVVCIVGPSGSGKSTILRCINGLESYSGGSVDIDGLRVDRQHASIKRSVPRWPWCSSASTCSRTARCWRT